MGTTKHIKLDSLLQETFEIWQQDHLTQVVARVNLEAIQDPLVLQGLLIHMVDPLQLDTLVLQDNHPIMVLLDLLEWVQVPKWSLYLRDKGQEWVLPGAQKDLRVLHLRARNPPRKRKDWLTKYCPKKCES